MTAATPRLSDSFHTGLQHGRATARMGRLHNARVPATLYAVGCVGGDAPTLVMVAGVLAIIGTYAAAAAINDVVDLEADRSNGRVDLPLVDGDATLADARGAAALGVVVAVVAQLGLPQPAGFVTVLLAVAIGWSYSCAPLALERRGWLGPTVLAVGYLALPLWFSASVVRTSFSLSAAVGLIALGAAVLAHKDVRDVVGDAVIGKRTPVVRHGVRGMARQAATIGGGGLVALTLATDLGSWAVPAVSCVASLAIMAVAGHAARPWGAARLTVVATAVLLAL